MLFRFMELTRQISDFSEIPVSKNGNRFLSFRAKQLRDDGTMCPEMTLTVWGDEHCKLIHSLEFGELVQIEGTVKEFGTITSIEKGVM